MTTPDRCASAVAMSRRNPIVQAIRYDGFMYAHTICDICGIKPGTLRQARWRARRAGQSDPMPSRHVSNTRRVVSIRDAVNWLQRTGRHVELLRLAEWYSDMTAMARRDMRDHVVRR